MSSLSRLHLLMLMLLSLLFITNMCDAGDEVEVEILNIITPEGKDVVIHCKSKDDDLGIKNLGPHQTFSFRFSPNVWGTTLFYCKFTWLGGSGWFNVYDQGRDQFRCSGQKKYSWYITPGGLCLDECAGNPEEKGCYAWK
ncbi:hypothetical protein Tsubulata_040576 [Turnera subulata]|uniref:S-protein homolog n=1 Tax=Turnera subulata TaxID=218843 RepID=A0A9Q0J9H2_9ROSI|nr:hypothetical protein Tsubulata_040576 [Turnera subulata]